MPQAVLVNTKILRYYIFAAYAAFDRSQRKKFTAGIGGGEQMSGTGIVWEKNGFIIRSAGKSVPESRIQKRGGTEGRRF